ncbi:NAD(P)/FAD-dependent oxidoreductase, partial [Yoonia sp.]|uniref:NAD(P)/FAD-dependent oxidoreductase n=1 Tax=Yoonia sp. TaxID=2212373 RepID=UPI003A4D2ED0
PDLTLPEITARLARQPRKLSTANRLRRALSLEGARQALVMECARPLPTAPDALATVLKTLPLPLQGPHPIDEAISTAGGIRCEAFDTRLMFRQWPGVFAAGEMLDWEAPTGGYLLTASLATGHWAGHHAAAI